MMLLPGRIRVLTMFYLLLRTTNASALFHLQIILLLRRYFVYLHVKYYPLCGATNIWLSIYLHLSIQWPRPISEVAPTCNCTPLRTYCQLSSSITAGSNQCPSLQAMSRAVSPCHRTAISISRIAAHTKYQISMRAKRRSCLKYIFFSLSLVLSRYSIDQFVFFRCLWYVWVRYPSRRMCTECFIIPWWPISGIALLL